MCRNVEVAEWSREVSSAKKWVKLGSSGDRATGTFDGDELDHYNAETETSVRAGLKLDLSRDGVARDVKRVGEGDGDVDLGMVRSSIHWLWPGLGMKRHFLSTSERMSTRT